MSITQSTSRAIIDWSTFSIAANQSVTFNNGAGATLNRVTGADASVINGALSATGSVYIVNPNGVIIGKSGVVNTGGTFVASTLDVANKNFDSGDPLTFSGASSAAVINLGYIGAAGRDVVLMAYRVQNSGTISAPNGDVGLLAGSTILLRDMETQGGMFAVRIGGAGSSVVNSGQLQAAMVELRANGGNIYALAGNTTGVINATGVSTHDGQVFLTAGQGYTDVQGGITATQSDGAGGQVTTSGATVDIAGANVTAGNWTIEQDNFVLTADSAAALSANLATTSVTIKTIGTDGGPSGGDIFVPASLTWSSENTLTLSANRDIYIGGGQDILNDVTPPPYIGVGPYPVYGAAITLAADNEGRGSGTVQFGAGATISTHGAVSIFYNPKDLDHRAVNSFSYTNPNNYSNDVTGGASLTAYMLVETVYDLQNIENNLDGDPLQGLFSSGGGDYALSRDINAAATANWNGGAGFMPIGTNYTSGGFSGDLLGNGHAISNLTINSSAQYVGLFAVSTGTISGVDITSGAVTAKDPGISGAAVGGLVGDLQSRGVVSNDSESITVTAANYTYTGGLVGLEQGVAIVDDSSSSGSVSARSASKNATYVGGLVGAVGLPGPQDFPQEAMLNASASTATVMGSAEYAGGLAGLVGGYYVSYSTLSNDYAIGVVNVTGSVAGGLVGLNQGEISQSGSASLVSGAGPSGGSVGGFAGSNSGTISTSFATGAVTGVGGAGANVGGFAGSNSGTVSSSFAAGPVTSLGGAGANLGGFAGANSGTLSTSYATGSVTGAPDVSANAGGFVGSNSGAISNSYATGSVTGGADAANSVGGFAGVNNLNATIEYVYSTGAATGGGLVGQNSGDVGDAYWDIGASGDTVAVSSNTGKLESVRGLGGTTRFSPFSAASYVGFDFTNIWTIDEGVSWPTLQ